MHIGSLPDYFFVWSKRDGEFQRVGIGGLVFGGYYLRPGQTVETRTVLLLRMSEGAFETELELSAGEREVMTKPIRFVVTAEAADPPGDLLVTKELVGGPAGEEAAPTATYETKIMNQGSSAVSQLTVADRYGEHFTRMTADPEEEPNVYLLSKRPILVSAEPAPSNENPSVQLASWDLAAFGKESLAPGESLVLRTTYGPGESDDCGDVIPGVVVEATVDGVEQRYGARAEDVTVGTCRAGNRPGAAIPGGEGSGSAVGAVAPPSGGEGPAAAEGDVLWAAFVLAGGGGALVAAALALRRRSRRRESGG